MAAALATALIGAAIGFGQQEESRKAASKMESNRRKAAAALSAERNVQTGEPGPERKPRRRRRGMAQLMPMFGTFGEGLGVAGQNQLGAVG
jgi:hypothetical protein